MYARELSNPCQGLALARLDQQISPLICWLVKPAEADTSQPIKAVLGFGDRPNRVRIGVSSIVGKA